MQHALPPAAAPPLHCKCQGAGPDHLHALLRPWPVHNVCLFRQQPAGGTDNGDIRCKKLLRIVVHNLC